MLRACTQYVRARRRNTGDRGRALGQTVSLAYREGVQWHWTFTFREDVAEHIVSTAVGMLSAAAAHGLTNREYVRGILDFARAEALGYRIPWSWVEGKLRAALAGSIQLTFIIEKGDRNVIAQAGT